MINVSEICKGYLTSDILGVGGVIKETPEDFVVTEIPAYEPSGSGEHLYLTIEKRGITTLEAIRRVAQELKISEKEIGYAGMKDAVGVTRQRISLLKIKAEDVAGRDLNGVKVLDAVRHGNKLKIGHLKGNRFRIVVRGVFANSYNSVSSIMGVLITHGVPNWFGYQRYGIQGNSHLIGYAMLQKDWQAAVDSLIGTSHSIMDDDWKSAINSYKQGRYLVAFRQMPKHCRSERDILQRLISKPDQYEKAFSAVHPRLKKLYLAAYQSSLFDKVVNLRLAELDQIWQGDLAWKHLNGSCFMVEDIAVDSERAAQFEISATGPMFGCRMKQPAGRQLLLEQQVLADANIAHDAFDLGGGLSVEGERRPLRVPLGEPVFQFEGDALILEFTLPKGCFATSVVREFTKNF